MTHAIRVHAYGGPEVLKWEEVEIGPPGPGEVRIKQTAVCSCPRFESHFRVMQPDCLHFYLLFRLITVRNNQDFRARCNVKVQLSQNG